MSVMLKLARVRRNFPDRSQLLQPTVPIQGKKFSDIWMRAVIGNLPTLTTAVDSLSPDGADLRALVDASSLPTRGEFFDFKENQQYFKWAVEKRNSADENLESISFGGVARQWLWAAGMDLIRLQKGDPNWTQSYQNLAVLSMGCVPNRIVSIALCWSHRSRLD